MNSSKQHIFSETTCPSREALLKYHSGNLSAHERHAVEHHLVDCDFCSEALEGFAGMKNINTLENDLSEIKNKLLLKKPEGKIIPFNKVWFAAASLAVIIFVSVYLLNQFRDAKKSGVALVKEQPAKNEISPSAPPAQQNTTTGYTALADSISVTDKSFSGLAKNNFSGKQSDQKQIEREKVAAQPQTLTATSSGAANDLTEPQPAADEIAATEMPAEYKSTEASPHRARKEDFKPAATAQSPAASQIVFIEDLKTIDYAYGDKNNVNREADVPAQFEKEKAKTEEEEKKTKDEKTKTLQYTTVLETALHNYNKKNFSVALESLNLILTQYPNDLNGHFYSALCLKGLKRYDEAMQRLTIVTHSADKTFFEEAEWNVALVYSVQNKTAEAKNLLQKIADGKGFYSEKAKEKLNLLH